MGLTKKHVPGVMRRQYICSLSNGRLFLSVVVGVHHSMSSAMNVLSAFRSLALLSLSVNSTEQRLMRSHLELFLVSMCGGRSKKMYMFSNLQIFKPRSSFFRP